jgi:hypothetical protein
MIYTLTFTDIVTSVFSAMLLLAALYATGRLLHARLKWRDTTADAAIVTGMAFNHLAFLLLSLCFEGETTVMLMHSIHILAIALAYLRHPGWFRRRRRFHYKPFVILGALYLPYLFSPISPPMNFDAVFAYVHNAEWVYHHGLAFNPSSSAYTTMPMGVEYLFAQVFPLGGKLSIFMLDAFFGLLLVRRIYLIALQHLPPRTALVLVLATLLVPEGIPFLFGIAKVDTINIYLIISGFAWIAERQNPFRLWFTLLAFSMACAVKYTGWLQLLLPVAITVVLLVKTKGISKGLLAGLLPLLFIAPVLMKNLIQTGNPLVGLKWSPAQHTYVEPHSGMTKEDLSQKISGSIRQEQDHVKTLIQISYYHLNFILYGILLVLLLAARSLRVDISDLRWLIFYLLAGLLPWHFFVGTSLQPPRFLMAFYFIILLSGFIIFFRIIARRNADPAPWTRYAFMLVFVITFFNTYYRHGNRIAGFMQSQHVSLQHWYEQTGNYIFAITTRLRDEGWLCQRIMYMSPVAKGLLSSEQISQEHEDRARWSYRTNFSVMRDRYDYVLCHEDDILKYGLQDRQVVLQSGHMYLLKLH